MKIKAKLKNLRISPRKVRVSADMIRGCDIKEAIFRLENTTKKANEPLQKLLESAIANAENNFDLSVDNLRVAEILVGEGVTLKRWRPRAYGRASQILKRSSHIYLTLEVGKTVSEDDKSVDKKETKEQKKAEIIKDKTEGSEKTVEKVVEKKGSVGKKEKRGYYKVESKRKESREKGWSKKIFRKKSM